MKLLTIILFLSAFNLSSNTDSTKKLRKFLFLPIVFKSPETGLSGGISAGYNFKTTNKEDTLTRSSIIQGVTLFTKRGQNVQALDVAIYFPLEKNILYLQSSHAYYPDKFWGLGPKTADKWQERYIFEQFYFFPHYKYQFKKHFFIGVLYEFQKVFNISYKKYGIFDTTFFPGKSEYKTSGAGGQL
ncbi:MAG: hypothetical protein HYX39_04435 [Bacteroidetes bacterium]|nr:hypothetical protein [Bacteroidota bacterium]